MRRFPSPTGPYIYFYNIQGRPVWNALQMSRPSGKSTQTCAEISSSSLPFGQAISITPYFGLSYPEIKEKTIRQFGVPFPSGTVQVRLNQGWDEMFTV